MIFRIIGKKWLAKLFISPTVWLCVISPKLTMKEKSDERQLRLTFDSNHNLTYLLLLGTNKTFGKNKSKKLPLFSVKQPSLTLLGIENIHFNKSQNLILKKPQSKLMFSIKIVHFLKTFTCKAISF